ncbi:nuclear transport factor 2 family protein [Solimonas sp. K1W22B-7]|uniref:nuclear transport factor 2 family protein n=1 Tax=Solimonas sp. K1W22B-7 TaxID=2303331 RepID=UPI000E32DFF8|nr:nuclear transport factor 2 family protein [Solimonas sp. K1W22B-7]AXQ31320.1 nuclear transport factor 2 family protein [Solimonas sp. K1W22B-7]
MDDHRAIERLLYRYAELIDAGDFAGVGQLFERGRIVAGGNAVAGAAAVQGMYESYTRRYACGTPRTQHLMGNVCIDVDAGGRSAQARLRFTVFQALEDFPLQAIIAGRYQDRFARDEGGWYFAERRMQPELMGDLSRHLLLPVPQEKG